MRLIGYYALHTFLNAIKKMFRSTVVIVIAAIMGIGVLFGVATAVITNVVEQKNDNNTKIEQSVEEQNSDESLNQDDSDHKDEDEISAEDARMIKSCFEFGIPLVLIAFLLLGIYSGTKKGSDIFLMADVNLLFTAPLKPQSILMFRLTFQMAATLLGSLYLLFQIPNLIVNLKFNGFTVLFIFVAWILLMIYQKLVSVLAYTLTATHKHLKKYVKSFILIVIAVLAVWIGIAFLQSGKTVEGMINLTFGAKWTRMIPVIGWFNGMLMNAIEGQISTALIYTLLLVVGIVLLFFGIWKIKADFYEDAISGAAHREQILTAAKEGRTVAAKERSQKIKRNATMKGYGASVFFWKEIYNRRRFAKFGFITNTMLINTLAVLSVSLFFIKLVKFSDFAIVGIVLAVCVFFRNFGSPIAVEKSKNWLFLVPDNPYKKVIAAMLVGTYCCLIDMIPAFIIGVILIPSNPILVLLWLLMVVTLDFILSSSGTLLEAVLPTSAFDVLRNMIHMMIKFIVLFISVILIAVGYALSSIELGLTINIIVNIIVGTIIFLPYPSILHSGN